MENIVNKNENLLLKHALPFNLNTKLEKTMGVFMLIGWFFAFFVLAFIFSFPLFFGASLLPSDALLESSPDFTEAFVQTLNLIIGFSGFYIVVYIIAKFIEKRPLKTFGFLSRSKLKRMIIGFFIGTLSMSILALLLVILGEGSFSFHEDIWLVLPLVCMILIGWIVQGLAEELFFQGLFMPKAVKMYGLGIGVSISAVLFAFVHGFNEGITLLAILNLTLYAVFAAFFALYEEGILGIASYHIAWNFTQGTLFGLNVSGGSNAITLIETKLLSPNIFTGHEFGPEGGLLTTLVLSISLLIIILLHIKKRGLDHG